MRYPPLRNRTIADRYWEKVRQGDGCWDWMGSRSRNGYGQMRIDGRIVSAHRVAWALANGPIPNGYNVLHHCDTPPCTRADHLFLGTLKDNSVDMARKGRWRNQTGGVADNVVCLHGHPYLAGVRRCITCQRAAQTAFKKRQIAKRPPARCAWCGTAFPAFGKRKYCSERCKWAVDNHNRSKTKAAL